MRKILLAGGVVFAFSLFLIVSNFSINSGVPEMGMRSIDLSDLPTMQNKVLVLHETEIGNQYIMPYKKSVPNSQWEETHIALDVTISENSVQKDITYDYYSEMPTPSQKVLDRAAEKAKNPVPRIIPVMQDSENELTPSTDGAINIDDFLDKEKKS